MWYRSGTVAVQSGSVTVTGNGTSWAAPAVKEGYAFIGPDGRLYEIEAVNSGTALTLASAYGGTDDAAGAYVVAPTQSLNVELHAAVRDLLTLASTRLSTVESDLTDCDAAIDSLNAAVTAASILAELRTVDGPGSKLDADTVDGIHGSSLARLNADNDFSGTQRFDVSGQDVYFDSDTSDRNMVQVRQNAVAKWRWKVLAGGDINFESIGDVDKLLKNGHEIWHAGNCNFTKVADDIDDPGSSIFAKNNSSTARYGGDTISGTDLLYASVTSTGGSSPVGLWQCRGRAQPGEVTVWKRIS